MTTVRASGGFVTLAIAAILGYFLASGNVQAILYDIIGLSAVVAVVVGIHMHRPATRVGWYLVAFGLFMLVLGDFILNLATINAPDYPFPSISDAFYILGNLTLVAFGVMVIRARSRYRDISAFIDATILATTATFLAWVFLMQPLTDDASLTGVQKAVSLAYPAMMTIMFVVGARLLLTGGTRTPSFVFILLAIASSLLADIAYAELTLSGDYYPGHPIDLVYLLWYIFWAAAALHPSMVSVTSGSDSPVMSTSIQRFSLLVAAVLLVPVTTVIRWWRDDPNQVPVFIAFSTVLFLLVLWRMRNSIRLSERAFEGQQLAFDRERVLHDVSSGLAISSTREDAFEAVRSSLGSIADGRVSVKIALIEGAHGRIVSTADPDEQGRRFPLVPAPAGIEHREQRHQDIARALQHGVDWPGEDSGARREVHVVNPEDPEAIALMLTGTSDTALRIADLLRGVGVQLHQALERIALVEDISRRRNEAFFHSLVRNSSDVTMILEANGDIRYVSPAAQSALGFDPGDLVGTALGDVVHGDDACRVADFLRHVASQDGGARAIEFRMRNVQDTWHDVEAMATNLLHDPDVGGVVLNVHDITVRKQSEAMLEYQAFHDQLTSLPNRALFLDRLDKAMTHATNHGERVAVLFIDLDRFKFINDSLGHDGGDALLVMASQRIRQCVGEGNTVARLGGDEFTVILTSQSVIANPAILARELVDILSMPFMLKDRELVVTVSIGVAVSDTRHEHGEDLLREADIAMYQAKSNGKNGVVVFDVEMGNVMENRLRLEQDLHLALEHDAFVLHYQPEVDLESGRIVSFEALIRWRHPEHGLLYPGDFIPLAEESGLIVRIGRWVAEEACRQVCEWRERYPHNPVSVSVNVSPRQLLDRSFVGTIADILHRTALPASALRLEITESTLMHDLDVSLRALTALRELGVQLAIDDFGHGYSSLGYLRHFPLDGIKLDQSFLRDSLRPEQDDAIIHAVTALAHILGIKVTVEGIETVSQLARVRSLSCDQGQGYYLARPRDKADVPALLDAGAWDEEALQPRSQ